MEEENAYPKKSVRQNFMMCGTMFGFILALFLLAFPLAGPIFFIKLPSKLSFLRNLFIPALTPTPLPPGEGLFRIKALASVSCKIVVWKEVYYSPCICIPAVMVCRRIHCLVGTLPLCGQLFREYDYLWLSWIFRHDSIWHH